MMRRRAVADPCPLGDSAKGKGLYSVFCKLRFGRGKQFGGKIAMVVRLL